MSALQGMVEQTFAKQIGTALREIREERGFLQKDIMRIQGRTTYAFVSHIESGKREPTLSSIKKHLNCMGADWSDFAEHMGWL